MPILTSCTGLRAPLERWRQPSSSLLVGAGTGAVALDQGSSSIDVRAAGPDVADGSDGSSPELAEPDLVPLPEPPVPVRVPSVPLPALPAITVPTVTVPTTAPPERLETNSTYLARADGSGLKRIGDSSAFPSVRFSPDGRHLAFLRDGGIWISDVDGTKPRPVTGHEGACCHLDWSPDGGEIAYEVPGSGMAKRIHGVAPDGGNRRVLVENGVAPAWAPKGGRLVYATGARELHVRESDGSVHLIAPSIQSAPAWSPDGQRLLASGTDAETGKPGTWIFAADGSGRQALAAAGEFSRQFLTWSPDGSFVTWGGGIPTPESERRTLIARPDGSGLRDLGVGSTAPRWLSSGDKLIVHRDFGKAEVVNADGSDRRPFLQATVPYGVGPFSAAGGWVLIHTW